MSCFEVTMYHCTFDVDFDVSRKDGLPIICIGENDLTDLLSENVREKIVTEALQMATHEASEYDPTTY